MNNEKQQQKEEEKLLVEEADLESWLKTCRVRRKQFNLFQQIYIFSLLFVISVARKSQLLINKKVVHNSWSLNLLGYWF